MDPDVDRALEGDAAGETGDEATTVTAVGAVGPESATSAASTAVQAARRTAHMPLDLLRKDEAARASVFARLMVALSVFGVVLTPFLDVDRVARETFIVTISLVAVIYGWVAWFASDVARYSPKRLGVASMFAAIPATMLLYVFGVYSAAPIVTVLALHALALGQSLGWALVGWGTAAGGHAALALAISTGALDDHGMTPAAILSTDQKLLVMVCVQSVYLLALALGRWSRAKTVAALVDLELAVRQVAERDALLAEVQRRIEATARPGGPGRFSGHTLGSFRLGALIGRGGMGEVYDAVHVVSGESAAVKLLSRHALAEPTKIARFLRELEVARSLRAPNVVRVVEIGDLGADLPYLAMERLAGIDLDQLLRRRGRLSLTETVEMAAQVARGLATAHAAGIVHRDLKPSNVFLTGTPEAPVWKILDFGVSKLGGDSQLTQDRLVGTPAFMAPEQAQAGDTDSRTDVYGLAAITYVALTGHLPFGRGAVSEVLARVIRDAPRPPSELADLPVAVDVVVMRGLAKAPGDRFATPEALAHALTDAVGAQVPRAVLS